MDLAGLAADLRRVTVELTDGGRAVGSGVVWAPDWVVTNAHVAPHADVMVRRADGAGSRGRVVARDRGADLALLHVPGLGLSAATFAPADELRVGSLSSRWGIRSACAVR